MNELSIFYIQYNSTKKQLTTITLASAPTKALHYKFAFLYHAIFRGYLYKEKVLASYGFLIRSIIIISLRSSFSIHTKCQYSSFQSLFGYLKFSSAHTFYYIMRKTRKAVLPGI